MDLQDQDCPSITEEKDPDFSGGHLRPSFYTIIEPLGLWWRKRALFKRQMCLIHFPQLEQLEVYCHAKQCNKALKTHKHGKAKVEFTLGVSKRGPAQTHIREMLPANACSTRRFPSS